MNEEKTYNLSGNVVEKNHNVVNGSMSCKKENSDLSKKRKYKKIITPQYVLINTKDVVGKVRKLMLSVGKKDRSKNIIQIKNYIDILQGRTSQHHCFAYIFCSARELLKYFELEKLCMVLNLMVSIRHDFYTNNLIKREYE